MDGLAGIEEAVGPEGGTPLLGVTGQTVVVTATTDVITVVPSGGQLVTSAPHLVIVVIEVVKTVDVVQTWATTSVGSG
jgi:hypothetical protein